MTVLSLSDFGVPLLIQGRGTSKWANSSRNMVRNVVAESTDQKSISIVLHKLMIVCFASLCLVDLKRVSAEKTPKVRNVDHFVRCINKRRWSDQVWVELEVYTCWSVCFLRVSGDSFVVNAFLRRGMEECERYSATDHKLKNMQVSGFFSFKFGPCLYS